jgi:L-ribulose-5-phosphate 3-epimerase
MNKIGIIQGRLLPKDIKQFQLFPSETWEQEFEISKSCGFSTIELIFGLDDYRNNPLMDKKGRNKIARLSESLSLPVSSICAHFFKVYGFFRDCPQIENGNISILKELIESCEQARCQKILIPFLEETVIKNEQDKEDIFKFTDSVYKLLEGYEVTLCFETSLPWTEMLALMKKINHPNIRIYYDIGNSAYFKYNPAEEIRRLSGWIRGVHIKDRNESGNNVILGTGLVDFAACFQALKEINYKGSYILETVMGSDPIETAKMHLEFVKAFI